MSNSSDGALLCPLNSPEPSVAATLEAAGGALLLASASELEGNTSRREWLHRGLAELAQCRRAVHSGNASIGARERARLGELELRAATLLEQIEAASRSNPCL